MPNYMLLLHESPSDFADISPEEMQAIISKYSDWRAGLAASGHLVGGEKLRDDGGRILRAGDDGVRVLDGPYSETKEVIGGYFAIQAESYDEAVRISSDCPHLAFGGSIELREVELTHA